MGLFVYYVGCNLVTEVTSADPAAVKALEPNIDSRPGADKDLGLSVTASTGPVHAAPPDRALRSKCKATRE